MYSKFYFPALLWAAYSFHPSPVSKSECSRYYPMEEGTSFEITVYDEKNIPNALMEYSIVQANDRTSIFISEIQNPEGDIVATAEYGVTCKGNGVLIDFNSMMSAELLKQYEGKPLRMRGINIELPNDLKIGQKLPDAEMETSFSSGTTKISMSIKMQNRKVEGNETLQTPVGKLDCVIVSYKTEIISGIKKTVYIKEWLAEGIGLVKSEEYEKNGTLVKKSILTEFDK